MKKYDDKAIVKESTQVTRRNVLIGFGAAAATLAVSGKAISAVSSHDHGEHSVQKSDILDAAIACTDKGGRCISHCLVAWSEGNLDLAACAKKVNEMNAVCEAFSKLLAANSTHIKEYAKMCKTVCKECAEECRRHDKHSECRECAEACEALIKEIDKSFA